MQRKEQFISIPVDLKQFTFNNINAYFNELYLLSGENIYRDQHARRLKKEPPEQPSWLARLTSETSWKKQS